MPRPPTPDPSPRPPALPTADAPLTPSKSQRKRDAHAVQALGVQLVALPAFSKPVKGLTRLLASRAADCELDGQGRILLPPTLRSAAALGREATVVGVLNRFEVWAPERWAAFLEGSQRLLEDVSLGVEWPPAPRPSTGET